MRKLSANALILASFLALFLCALSAADDPTPPAPAAAQCAGGMELLADGRHITKAIVALNHSEEVQKHENKLAELRKEKEFVEKYFAPGAPLSYPNNLLFLSILGSVAQRTTQYTANAVVDAESGDYSIKTEIGEQWVRETHLLLRELFSSLQIKTPATAQEALEQSSAIEQAINRFKNYLGASFNYTKQTDDPKSWPTPKEFLKIREAFLSYLDTNPDPKEIWRYIHDTRGFNLNPGSYDGGYYYHIGRGTIASGGIKMLNGRSFPNPRVQESPGLLVHLGLGHSIDSYNRPDVKRINQLAKEIKREENAIAKLVGKAPPPPQRPVPAAYTAPPAVVKALGPEAPSTGGAREALRYRVGLIAKYLNGTGFFASGPGKAVLADPNKYETMLLSFSPDQIPQVREDGTYDRELLARFREHTKELGVTPEAFIDYSRELHALSEDPRAKSELLAVLKDRKAGNPQLMALRELAGSLDTPVPELAQHTGSPGMKPSEGSQAAPYARPLTPELNLHHAITELARETARRGSRATANELLRDLAKASLGLEKTLRRNSLGREEAIDRLSPSIERALAEAQALAIDLAQMQSHAESIREQIGNLRKDATERAKRLSDSAREPGAVDSRSLPLALEEISLELDQLKSQETDADYLLRSLGTLRNGLKDNREYLIDLQSLLRHADPLHPNQIDNQILLGAIKKLPKDRG